MVKALRGSLDYVMTDIAPGDDGVPRFDEMTDEFRDVVGKLMFESLSKLEFTNENMIQEMMEAVGNQMSNTEGPDFSVLVTLPSIVLMVQEAPENVMKMMGEVKDAIVNGTVQVVRKLKLEDKYQNAALRAL